MSESNDIVLHPNSNPVSESVTEPQLHAQMARSIHDLQNMSEEASSLLSTLRKANRKHRVRRKPQRATARLVRPSKAPAPIGMVPRMLDQLKRRCARLLITTRPAQTLQATQLSVSTRISAAVCFNSRSLKQILHHWHNRSAFADPPGQLEGAVASESSSPSTCSQLTLLVWRVPKSESLVGCVTAGGALAVQAWHVIPVTQLEAAEFHRIPANLRETLVNDAVRNRISDSLAALMATQCLPLGRDFQGGVDHVLPGSAIEL